MPISAEFLNEYFRFIHFIKPVKFTGFPAMFRVNSTFLTEGKDEVDILSPSFDTSLIIADFLSIFTICLVLYLLKLRFSIA